MQRVQATLTRRVVQSGFVALTLVGVFFVGGNAERWCPFGGIETFYAYVRDGNLICSLGISNLYILGGVLVMTVLLRRAFCGWVCPLGALSEWIQSAARRLGLRPRRVRPVLDKILALLKYGVLAVILVFTWRTSELVFRGYDPCYALLSRHGEDITFWAYVVAGAIVLGSAFVVMPFCRWLCPLAAVLNPVARFGVTRVHRDAERCIGCTACARVCPMEIPVDTVDHVAHARCLACLNCVRACPPVGAGALRWGPAGGARGWSQGVLVAALLLCVGVAVAASYAFPLPSFVHTRGVLPPQTAEVELAVYDLTCRGRASLLVYLLERDDDLAVPGALRMEAWPGPGPARVRLLYDPALADEGLIKAALTEAYYDRGARLWRPSPFRIKGYDPLADLWSDP
ncbi:MAG: 4Fe-4S binding protein [Phycisphaerales bacterium]|nr:4Fe-4S binding protein [Phycisphaerales bacterium]